MKEFTVSTRPELAATGASRVLAGILPEEGYTFGDMELSTPAGIAYDLVLSNTGEAFTLTGTIAARAETQCARCLERAVLDVKGEVSGYYLADAQADAEGLEADEFAYVADDGTIDIAPALLAGLCFATPFIVLCKDDCKGLCPRCGANLNDDPGHAHDDGPDPGNPFAVLKNLKLS